MTFWSFFEQQKISGQVVTGRSTKKLIRSIEPKQIIVIDHLDLDEVAAAGIIEAKVRAVINVNLTMSGTYPLKGPLMLIEAGIPILEVEHEYYYDFDNGTSIEIDSHYIHTNKMDIPFRLFTIQRFHEMSEQAQRNWDERLRQFIDNTLHYAHIEKDAYLEPLKVPELKTDLNGHHVVIVVRGSGYKQDLLALHDYIADYRPILIGVDGGADALLSGGYCPHIIIGDMDSVSDKALSSGSEVVVHAYPDGRAPGWNRVRSLGVVAHKLPAHGTSEDVAMWLAYEKGAELIVTLGTHTHMIDFLEKGRSGMASTLLVRMKVGSKLIDAKGVSKLYHRKMRLRSLWPIPAAALFPLMMLSMFHPGMRHFFDMMWAYVRLTLS